MLILAASLGQGSRVKDELQDLRRRDLAIAQFVNGRFIVIGLDGRIQQFDLRPGRFCSATRFSANGGSLVCDSQGSLSVLNSDFATVWERHGAARNVSDLALSADGNKAVFATWSEPDRKTKQTQIVLVSRSDPEEVLLTFRSSGEAVRVGNLSWDAAGRQIAFSVDDEIQIYDFGTHVAKNLAHGFDPSWSPDGRWIAYRSTSGRLMLFEMAAAESKPAGPQTPIIFTAHWSPDSQYVFVAETDESARSKRACFDDSILVIYRLSDNARKVAYDPCGVRTETFGWISGAAGWEHGARGVEKGNKSAAAVKK